MENSQIKTRRKLADMQLWAADEMKKYAEITSDPQLKKKYEQVAALNRLFYEQLATEDNDKTQKSMIVSETDMLMRAYYCQNSLYQVFSQLMTEDKRPDGLDEICDRQIMICRELLGEAENRISVINSWF